MAYEVVNLEQRSKEWFDFRKKHIGASEAPIIMKESPWKTPRQLWMEKLDLSPKNDFKSKAMQRGVDLEEEARLKYIKITGVAVLPLVAKSVEYPFMIASYDGVSHDRKTIVEIKCPTGDEDHDLAKQQQIPKKYLYQLIQQMIVLDVDSVDYFSYKDPNDVALVHLRLDDVKSEVKRLIKEEKKFWDCWQNLEEPELITEDFVEKTDADWNVAVSEYLTAKKKLKECEELEGAARSHLIQLSDGKNCEGGGIRISKHLRKGFVDYSAIPELKNVNLDKYRKPSIESWRFMEA
jgi:putative phage-type endonuclease